MHSANIMF